MKKWIMLQLSAIIIVVLQATAIAWADDQMMVADFSLGVDAQGVPNGWQLKEKSGQADCATVSDDGLHALLLRSANTSFAIQKKVQVDVTQYPILSWKWKATTLPEGGDFRRSQTDDQAAQLFLPFSRTKAIVYIWDTTAPQGLMADAHAPFFMTIKVVVVRSGSAEMGKWITETRNVYEDYQTLYGDSAQPPMVSGMRIQINSQHTHTSAESYFADVIFTKR
jgi:hypothetical protein